MQLNRIFVFSFLKFVLYAVDDENKKEDLYERICELKNAFGSFLGCFFFEMFV